MSNPCLFSIAYAPSKLTLPPPSSRVLRELEFGEMPQKHQFLPDCFVFLMISRVFHAHDIKVEERIVVTKNIRVTKENPLSKQLKNYKPVILTVELERLQDADITRHRRGEQTVDVPEHLPTLDSERRGQQSGSGQRKSVKPSEVRFPRCSVPLRHIPPEVVRFCSGEDSSANMPGSKLTKEMVLEMFTPTPREEGREGRGQKSSGTSPDDAAVRAASEKPRYSKGRKDGN